MNMAPTAQALQAQGRGNDSMLVHMTPGEVKGLQALAVAHGGSLTINPQTGLPEAGFLSSILPIAAGFALGPAGFGLMSAGMAGLTVGGITALMSGDLGQGLMAGLGAFGGANLGSALSSAGTAGSEAAVNEAATRMALEQSGNQAALQAIDLTGGTLGTTADLAAGAGSGAFNVLPGATSPAGVGFGANVAATQAAPGIGAAMQGATTPAFMTAAAPSTMVSSAPSFANAMQGVSNLGTSQGWSNLGTAMSDQWAGMGAMEKAATVGGALSATAPLMEPEPMVFPEMPEGYQMTYAEPGPPTEREYMQPTEADILRGGREYTYFTPSNPVPYAKGDSVWEEEMDVATDEYKDRKHMEKVRSNMNPFLRYIYDETGLNLDLPATRNTKADGGMVHMEDGGFVMDARSVSEMGNGSSSAGLERLSQMGGMPIRGAGDGVSDSIPATINGSPVAAVAREEAYFSPEAVKRIGGGSIQRGSDKLYEMMDKAIAARKKAGRGTDSGLGTLMA